MRVIGGQIVIPGILFGLRLGILTGRVDNEFRRFGLVLFNGKGVRVIAWGSCMMCLRGLNVRQTSNGGIQGEWNHLGLVSNTLSLPQNANV